MLTKEERKAIAERITFEFDFTEDDDVYEVLVGDEMPENTSWETDCKVVRDRLIELCDTSNMVELPIDKNGEVIRVDDNVYDIDGTELVVESLRYCTEYGCVVICRTSNDTLCTYSGNELNHKAATTEDNVKEFNEALKTTAQFVERSMNECVEAMKKLAEVFNRVSGNDD